MKKVWIGIGAVLSLAVIGVSVYVASIDWNEHKDKIAAQFSEVTGKVIVFDGAVSFSLFPRPYLSATRVQIYNPGAPSNKPLATMDALVAKLSLLPLLQGNFEVERMSLVKPQINMELEEDGRLNWQSEFSEEQRRRLENVEISLNSVTIEEASVNFSDPFHGIGFTLDNLNGEVIAQNIMGPYRIEGNYVKDGNPEGFAISIGQLSPTFATSLNVVVTHPTSESYLRFDGTFLLNNQALNGNVIFESKKLKNFIEANFKDVALDAAYDYPLAASMELNTNKVQVNLSNVVVKYGETQGAGNIQIPRQEQSSDYDPAAQEGEARKRLSVAFDFTNVDLKPLFYAFKKQFDTYREGAAYRPDWAFDIVADLRAVKGNYDDQDFKDLELSFDEVNNVLTINSLRASVPGETTFSLSGDIFSSEETLSYDLDTRFSSNELLRTLRWLNINPVVNTVGTYRRASGTAKFNGTLQKIQIAPFELSIDKSKLSGEMGIRAGDRPDALVRLNADMINFDNYLPPMPKEEQEKPLAERMAYRFSHLGFLNDFEMELLFNLDLGIYENMPYEKVTLDATLMNGRLEIGKLDIGNAANAAVSGSGVLSGFGSKPAFENVKYSLSSSDALSTLNKLEVKVPDWDFKQLKNLEIKGIATGGFDLLATKTTCKLGRLEALYNGKLEVKEGTVHYDGQLEAKHPDFVKMLQEMNYAYAPKVLSLGSFALNGKVVGSRNNYKVSGLEAQIGVNRFEGEVAYDLVNGRPNLLTTLQVNQLELERFFYNPTMASGPAKLEVTQNETQETAFLTPLSKNNEKFNFEWYQRFDFNGKISADVLSYHDLRLENAVLEATLANGIAGVTSLNGTYRGGSLDAHAELRMQNMPTLSGTLDFKNIRIDGGDWGGSRYGLEGGTANSRLSFDTLAASESEIWDNLNGNWAFQIAGATVKGWNTAAIFEDITKRKVSEGLAALVQENLQRGSTAFDRINGDIRFEKGAFNINSLEFSGRNITVTAGGDGSLRDWDMNAAFSVKYAEPKFLPGYSFLLKGNMAAPDLESDVKALSDLYDSRQQQLEDRKKEQEARQQERLNLLLEDQRRATEVLKETLAGTLSAEAEARKNDAYGDEARKAYENALAAIAENLQAAEALLVQVQVPLADEALIEEAKQKNGGLTAEVERIRKTLDEARLKDLRLMTRDHYDRTTETYNNSKVALFELHGRKDEFGSALAEIITSYRLDEDETLLKLDEAIEGESASLEEVNQEIAQQFTALNRAKTAEDLVRVDQSLQQLQERAAAAQTSLLGKIAEYEVYAGQKVEAETKAYQDRLRAEEVQRKLEENTGTISIKKTGKSVTVQRAIEDIEKAEELTSKEGVRVLDFSGNRVRRNEGGRTSEPVEKEEKKSGIVIRRSGGEKVPSGGVIIRK